MFVGPHHAYCGPLPLVEPRGLFRHAQAVQKVPDLLLHELRHSPSGYDGLMEVSKTFLPST